MPTALRNTPMRNRLRRFFNSPSLGKMLRVKAWLNPDQPEFGQQIHSRRRALRSIASRALGFGVVLLVLVKDDLEWHSQAITEVWFAMTGIMHPSEPLFFGGVVAVGVVGLGWVTAVLAHTVAVLCLRNQGWSLNRGTKLVVVLWLIALLLSLRNSLLLSWTWGVLGLVGVLLGAVLWWWSDSLAVPNREMNRGINQGTLLPVLTKPLTNENQFSTTEETWENPLENTLETIVQGEDLWVQPEPMSQQPQQFTACLVWLLGLFCWTMSDFAPWFKGWLSIIMIAAGINGVSTWRMGLLREHDPDGTNVMVNLWLDFRGWWGTEAQYVLPLKEFQQLWRVKLQEGGADVEISWLKLAGYRREVFLPSLLAGIAARPLADQEESVTLDGPTKGHGALPEISTPESRIDRTKLGLEQISPKFAGQPGVGQSGTGSKKHPPGRLGTKMGQASEPPSSNIVAWLCQHSHFVLQERFQDSLSLVTVLIPQGAGILAGMLLLLLGLALSFIVGNMPHLMFPYTIGLLCLSWFAPWVARQVYNQLAPGALPTVLPPLLKAGQTHIAEVAAGGLVLLIAMVGHNQDQHSLIMFLVQITSWLCVLVGVEIFRWVQRVPLVEKL